jgi:hypothetical protein
MCSANSIHYTTVDEIEIPRIPANPEGMLLPCLKRLVTESGETCNSFPGLDERVNLLHPRGKISVYISDVFGSRNFDFLVSSHPYDHTASDPRRKGIRRFSYRGHNIMMRKERLGENVKVRDVFPCDTNILLLPYVMSPDSPTPRRIKHDCDIVNAWSDKLEIRDKKDIIRKLGKRLEGFKPIEEAELLIYRVALALAESEDGMNPEDIAQNVMNDGYNCECEFLDGHTDESGIERALGILIENDVAAMHDGDYFIRERLARTLRERRGEENPEAEVHENPDQQELSLIPPRSTCIPPG